MAERVTVDHDVVGSRPIRHPKRFSGRMYVPCGKSGRRAQYPQRAFWPRRTCLEVPALCISVRMEILPIPWEGIYNQGTFLKSRSILQKGD